MFLALDDLWDQHSIQRLLEFIRTFAAEVWDVGIGLVSS